MKWKIEIFWDIMLEEVSEDIRKQVEHQQPSYDNQSI